MAVDPAGFVTGLNKLMRAVRNFEQQIREPRWRWPMPEMDSIAVSGSVRAAFRIAGAALAVVALLHLAGIIR